MLGPDAEAAAVVVRVPLIVMMLIILVVMTNVVVVGVYARDIPVREHKVSRPPRRGKNLPVREPLWLLPPEATTIFPYGNICLGASL